MREIVLPETKPALEWINGRAVQKVSPQRKHGRAQLEFGSALQAWARENGSGEVATEWEFRVQPPGEERRPLVPDVAFLAFGKVPYEEESAADIPRVAPDVVVEILSPRDLRRDIDEKIRVYLAAGTTVVFVVDTDDRTIAAHDRNGVYVFGHADLIRHAALPGFALPAARLFERPKPRR